MRGYRFKRLAAGGGCGGELGSGPARPRGWKTILGSGGIQVEMALYVMLSPTQIDWKTMGDYYRW